MLWPQPQITAKTTSATRRVRLAGRPVRDGNSPTHFLRQDVPVDQGRGFTNSLRMSITRPDGEQEIILFRADYLVTLHCIVGIRNPNNQYG